MLVSAEIRWFWEGDIPSEWDRWFRSGPFPPGGGAARVDEYLLDPRQTELGVKRRGGKPGVEIKGLVCARFVQVRWGTLSGEAQLWAKWASEAGLLENLPTVAIQKRRWLRKFDTAATPVREIALDESELPSRHSETLLAEGCNLELTQLTLQTIRPKWWTLGFEAFGSLDSLRQNLVRAVEHVRESPAPEGAAGLELSYPAWLAHCARQYGFGRC